jgi:hypothetical protein
VLGWLWLARFFPYCKNPSFGFDAWLAQMSAAFLLEVDWLDFSLAISEHLPLAVGSLRSELMGGIFLRFL